ncbi:MAG: serpin family protein [Dysgonamonadaceae bacterium]|jgi:serpin B|nr:serpin family protein [Dysgonamonadaceae bacterium]
MKSCVKLFPIFALSAAVFVSCEKSPNSTEQPEPIKIELNAAQTRILQSDKNFAFDFFSKIFAGEDKNFMVSPFSLSMALSMTWNGADGETKTAMKQALGLGGFADGQANEYFKKMKDALLKTDPSTKLAIANSVWTNKNIAIKPGFLSLNNAYYNASAQAVDFGDAKTLGRINQWASDNTEGLIKNVLEKTSIDDLMYLLNAIYFKGIWTSRFDKKNTSDMPFTSENGKSKDVPMMKQTASFNYTEDETLQAIQLPYGNQAFSMVVLLPQEGKKLQDLIAATQSNDYWEGLKSGMRDTKVNLFLPKFKTEYKKRLNDVLESMGMGIAFTPAADFSKMSDFPAAIAFVDQITYINTDEEGTEAAAVTVVGMELISANPSLTVSFRADKPFIYLIQENSTGAILFMGAVRNFE